MSESHQDPAAEEPTVHDAEIVEEPTAGVAVPVAVPSPDYTDAGVPTFDAVRDKIEELAGRAIGNRELDAQTPAGRSLDEQWEDRKQAARDKLDEIRKAMDD